MHPWLMALTICAMPLGAAVLFFSITRILRLLRESEVLARRLDRVAPELRALKAF